mmetsp:Transcript_35366/g.101578  ORF Transcript_35366/g.101578 Transcript_35366/m.101578 type:complete len:344 (-) Transcript_35366:224-1255(-)
MLSILTMQTLITQPGFSQLRHLLRSTFGPFLLLEVPVAYSLLVGTPCKQLAKRATHAVTNANDTIALCQLRSQSGPEDLGDLPQLIPIACVDARVAAVACGIVRGGRRDLIASVIRAREDNCTIQRGLLLHNHDRIAVIERPTTRLPHLLGNQLPARQPLCDGLLRMHRGVVALVGQDHEGIGPCEGLLLRVVVAIDRGMLQPRGIVILPVQAPLSKDSVPLLWPPDLAGARLVEGVGPPVQRGHGHLRVLVAVDYGGRIDLLRFAESADEVFSVAPEAAEAVVRSLHVLDSRVSHTRCTISVEFVDYAQGVSFAEHQRLPSPRAGRPPPRPPGSAHRNGASG